VAHQIGQIFLASLPVNQVDDDGPHDRTPLLIGPLIGDVGFRTFSAPREIGFTGSPKRFRQAGRSRLSRPPLANPLLASGWPAAALPL
jgi:hypothetical protein